jgi:hypothetical protein
MRLPRRPQAQVSARSALRAHAREERRGKSVPRCQPQEPDR